MLTLGCFNAYIQQEGSSDQVNPHSKHEWNSHSPIWKICLLRLTTELSPLGHCIFNAPKSWESHFDADKGLKIGRKLQESRLINKCFHLIFQKTEENKNNKSLNLHTNIPPDGMFWPGKWTVLDKRTWSWMWTRLSSWLTWALISQSSHSDDLT